MKKIERRKFFPTLNKEKYNELVIFYIEETEKCLNQDSLILVEALNITREKFEQSCMALIEQGLVKEMFAIQANVHHKIK